MFFSGGHLFNTRYPCVKVKTRNVLRVMRLGGKSGKGCRKKNQCAILGYFIRWGGG